MIRPLLLASVLLAGPVNYDPSREVDVELLLAVDISQSMDTDEQELQRKGYAAAITSPEVIDAIKQGGALGRIAVAYMEWGGIGEQYMVTDWQVIDGQDAADHFAEELLTAPMQQKQRTSIAEALKFGAVQINSNAFDGLRRVIDISGDGPNNQGGSATDARDAVVAQGITINGLPLMLKSNQNSWQAPLDMAAYYEDCIVGGPSHFTVPVRSKYEFEDALKTKLRLEIAGLRPSPKIIPVAGREPIRCGLFD